MSRKRYQELRATIKSVGNYDKLDSRNWTSIAWDLSEKRRDIRQAFTIDKLTQLEAKRLFRLVDRVNPSNNPRYPRLTVSAN